MDTLQLKYVFLFLLFFWGLEKGVASAQQTDDHVDQAAITYEEGFDLYNPSCYFNIWSMLRLMTKSLTFNSKPGALVA